MADRFFVALDAGTSALRCFVFDENADIVASCSEGWTYENEEGISPFARSFDTNAVWESCRRIIVGALSKAKVSTLQIASVSVTSQRQGVVFLDDNGHEIYAGPNTDLRAVFEGAAIDEKLGASVYETTGHLPSFLFAPAKLSWLKNHRPGDYAKISHILTIADWLAWRLTGIIASETTLANEAGLLNIHSHQCNSVVFDEMALKIEPSSVLKSGTVIGGITMATAAELGFVTDTPVAIAGADTQCGLLGLGVINESQVGIVSGWSTAIQMVTNRPILSTERKTWAGCFLGDEKWVLESSPGDTGNSYHWLANLLFGHKANSFGQMTSMASEVPIGSEGVNVFLGSPRMDMSKVGMRPGGFVLPVPLTFSTVGRGHLVRASLESIAYSIRANVEQIEELSGKKASRIAIGGGMTRTPAFTHILANVLGREIEVSAKPQVSALGAYLCARTAIGDFASLEEAAQSVMNNLTTIEPDIMDSAEYDDHYEQWLEMSNNLQEISL